MNYSKLKNMSIQSTTILGLLFCTQLLFAQIEELPPVDTLIQLAITKSQRLKTQEVNIAVIEQEGKIKRMDWMERISVFGNAAYGNSTTASLNATSTDQTQINTLRTDLFTNAGIALRFTLGDLMKRPQQKQLHRLRVEKAKTERAMLEDELALQVRHLYDDLNMTVNSLQAKADNLEAFHLSVEIAERYFKEGSMEVGSYTMILAQKIKAQEELEKSKSLAQMQLHELRLLTGWME